MMNYLSVPPNFKAFCDSRPPDLAQGIRGLGFELSGVGYACKLPVPPCVISMAVVWHFPSGGVYPRGWSVKYLAPLDEPVNTSGDYDHHSEGLLALADRTHVYRCDLSGQSAVYSGYPIAKGGYLYMAPWGERGHVLSVGMTVKEPEFSAWLESAQWDASGNPTFEPVPVEKKQGCVVKATTGRLVILHPGASLTVQKQTAGKSVFKVVR